jgi:hypothetical protein
MEFVHKGGEILAQVFAQGRRFFILVYQTLGLRIYPLISVPALKWIHYWNTHRTSIIFLAAINTSITTASEIGSRTVVSVVSGTTNEGFIVKTPEGNQRVHRQSLVNIFMTLLASLLGGPVYFITRRRHRFIFFISFGVVNSFLAQSVSTLVVEGVVLVIGRRMMFDFWYNASFKFLLFEYVRPYLLQHKASPFKIIGFRVGQDFFTTCIRVVILNVLRLSGH